MVIVLKKKQFRSVTPARQAFDVNADVLYLEFIILLQFYQLDNI